MPEADEAAMDTAEEIPTRTTWDVRSELTGAVVICDVDKDTATAERDRLNGEAAKVVATIGAHPMYEGGQRGRATTYRVVEHEVTDLPALREIRRGQLKAQLKATDDPDVKALVKRQLEQIDEEEQREAERDGGGA